MVKLICFVKRKDGMTAEDFHAYWRDRHGPLVAGTASGRHAIRYEQNHRPLGDDARTGVPDFDGVTEQWFASVDDFYASLGEDDYPLIDEDTKKFLDTSRLVWLLTEMPEVIIDGDVSAAD